MVGTDQRTGEHFDLSHLREPLEDDEVVLQGHLLAAQPSWRWQRLLAEYIKSCPRLIVGKGRQIGVTWVALAVDVEEAITMPGTASLIYRQREDDAIDNLRRWWVLYQSLPSHFTEHIKVLKPDRAVQPGEAGIALQFPDGAISEIFPMTSAASSGHGRSVRRITVDEGAHIESLSEIRAAIEPAAGRAAITVISTAAGRANVETGEGNEFHRLWVTAEDGGYRKLFLAYDVHPERDEHWYDTAPEVQSLKLHQRNEQFPRNEHEAFRLTAGTWFDEEALAAYADLVRPPEIRLHLKTITSRRCEWVEDTRGPLQVFTRPKAGASYAIGADVATGHGRDFSAAYVIDLQTMGIAAEYHCKIDTDLYARDLHFLGRWYNDAEIAVETGGGYGEVVVVSLRDGKAGRRPYPRLYRNVFSSQMKLPVSSTYGFPMTTRSRPQVINQMDRAIRERALPWVTNDLLLEMENFIDEPSADSRSSKRGPWPRAADGFHDDRVMACAIALEMYRLRGAHEPVRAPRPPSKPKALYPWLKPHKKKTPTRGRR